MPVLQYLVFTSLLLLLVMEVALQLVDLTRSHILHADLSGMMGLGMAGLGLMKLAIMGFGAMKLAIIMGFSVMELAIVGPGVVKLVVMGFSAMGFSVKGIGVKGVIMMRLGLILVHCHRHGLIVPVRLGVELF